MDFAYKRIVCTYNKGVAIAMEIPAELAKYYAKSQQSWCIKPEQVFILRIVSTVAMGGLIYGYDSGINYNYLPSIKNDLKNTFWNEDDQLEMMEVPLAGFIFPAAIMLVTGVNGLTMNMIQERKFLIYISDVMFLIGALIEATAFHVLMVYCARFVIGIGIGATLFASPIYIAEVSPYMIRGALVSTFYVCVAGGQLLAYLVSIAFSKVPGSWRWMVALEGVLAMVHYHLIDSVPESPKFLYRLDKEIAITILKFLYPNEAENEIQALQSSVQGSDLRNAWEDSILKAAWNDTAFGRRMIAGIGCLLAQQLVGINIVMHYGPKLLQMAGYNPTNRSKSLIIPGFSALGYLVCVFCVDIWGRRKLLLISIVGIIASLWMLSCAFNDATMNSSSIDMAESYFGNSSYKTLDPNISWTADFKGSTSFAGATMRVGLHMVRIKRSNPSSIHHLEADHHGRYKETSSTYNSSFLAFSGLQLYTFFYSLGMGIVPWIINSEIYAYKYIFGGTQLAIYTSLISNTFTSLLLSVISGALGPSNMFLLLCLVSCVVGLFIFLFVPETKGLRMEVITSMSLETETNHCSKVSKDDDCCMESTIEEVDECETTPLFKV